MCDEEKRSIRREESEKITAWLEGEYEAGALQLCG
jgi:hypothetical protein